MKNAALFTNRVEGSAGERAAETNTAVRIDCWHSEHQSPDRLTGLTFIMEIRCIFSTLAGKCVGVGSYFA